MKLKNLLIVIGAILIIGTNIIGLFSQKNAGKKCLDSITEKEAPIWIERTEKFLKEYGSQITPGSNVYKKAVPIPPELKKLKISWISVFSDSVRYNWSGKMLRTYLLVRKTDNGNFEILACYMGENEKIIWPRQEE